VKDRRYKVLCTRKLDDSWTEQALHEGIELESREYLSLALKKPEEIAAALEQNRAPFVFTSAYGVRAVADYAEAYPNGLRNKVCFCIDGTTKTEAMSAGFQVLGSARDARDLAKLIIESGYRIVMHCSAANRRMELDENLAAGGVRSQYCEVYTKALVPFRAGEVDGIIFYSPSQVDSFLVLNDLDKNTPVFCIGRTTARHLQSKGHEHIHIASEANTENILETLYQYFKQQ
jgi:uroporphyrinogen-III synthase